MVLRRAFLLSAALATSAVLAACSSAATPLPAPSWTPPPARTAPDYQLGGAYDPPAGVDVVARDRPAPPADSTYSPDQFDAACAAGGMPGSVVLRDRDLVAPAAPAYVFRLSP